MAEKVQKVFRNPNTIISMIAVLLVAVLCQSSGAESPALEYMAQEFTDLPFSQIVLVTTVCSLMMIPASLGYSFLRKKFSYRPIFIAASVLLILGGVMPAFTPYGEGAFTFVIVWRAIFGLGMGVMWPLAQSLIVELYDGQRQNTLLGFNSVVTACGGIMWANVGGQLALQGWRVSFFCYFIPIAILVFCAIFLPNQRASKQAEAKQAAEIVGFNEEEVFEEAMTADKGKFLLLTVAIMVLYFFFNFCNMTYFTNLSPKVIGEGIGESDIAGLAQSCFTIGSLVIGVIFGKVMTNKVLDRWALGGGMIIVGIGAVIVAQAANFPVLAIGSVIQGFGTGTVMPTFIGTIGNLAGKKNASMILGISTCLMGASQYFGPTIFNVIVESMGLAAGGPCMMLAAIGHLILAVITCIVIAIKGKPGTAARKVVEAKKAEFLAQQ